jgi:hypothetical protein
LATTNVSEINKKWLEQRDKLWCELIKSKMTPAGCDRRVKKRDPRVVRIQKVTEIELGAQI